MLEFGTSMFATFSAICMLGRDYPFAVSGGGNQSRLRKPALNPKSLATFSHSPECCVTKPYQEIEYNKFIILIFFGLGTVI